MDVHAAPSYSNSHSVTVSVFSNDIPFNAIVIFLSGVFTISIPYLQNISGRQEIFSRKFYLNDYHVLERGKAAKGTGCWPLRHCGDKGY